MGILQGGRDELGRSRATQNLALEAATSAGLRSSPTTTPRSGGSRTGMTQEVCHEKR